MAFFLSFTESLKQKWLQFFQANRDWILMHMEVESVYTPDGGKRPPSYLILGVANALEPKLAQLMLPFSKLNPDADTLIEVLDLHFDPDMALGNRSAMPRVSDTSVDDLDDLSTTSGTNGYSNGNVHKEIKLDSHEEKMMVTRLTQDSLDVMSDSEVTQSMLQDTHRAGGDSPSPEFSSGNEFHGYSQEPTADEFGDISFDDIKLEDSANDTITQANLGLGLDDINEEKDAFSDVLLDVWSEEGNKENQLGEELQKNPFDDSDIASLFPSA
jgi:Family of unknown function (DUF5331)